MIAALILAWDEMTATARAAHLRLGRGPSSPGHRALHGKGLFWSAALPWGFAARGLKLPPLPTLDGSLWELLTGMLGLGMLRSFEKARGVATESLKPFSRGR